ncbi:TonB-dependent receptor [Flavobacterium sp. FBOR7N2.3]|uniref:TonB-dependent receptor n=1 Tax=Flavobacterium magnesitis TaxID=3138077 RepID=A0ABV4TGR7_9FLAO
MQLIYKFQLSLFFLFGFVTSTNAQNSTISGKVTTYDGTPLTAAIVTITNSGKSVLTNSNGMYFFDNITEIKTIKVTFSGYESTKITVSKVQIGTVLPDIKLVPEIKELEEVVVSGSYNDKRKKEESLNLEIVSQSYIQRNLGGSLMQSLQRIPGVKTISIGSGSSKPLIRGLSFNQVVVVENGLKHEGQQWGADHGLEIDQYNVSRVEIIKGPSSFMFGSDAIGGAVNILPAPLPKLHAFGGNIDFTGKSNNAQIGGSFNLYGRNHNWFFDSRITAMDYADYRVPTDKVQVYNFTVPLYKNHLRNTAGQELDIHTSTGYVSAKFKSIFHISNVNSKSGFFANAHGLEPRNVDNELHDSSNRDILMPYQQVNHFKISNTTSFKIETHALQTQLGFQKNFRREWSQYVNHGYMPAVYPNDMYASENLERQYDKNTFLFNLKDEFELGQHKIAIGANVETQENQIGGWGFLIPAFNQFNTGLFVHDKVQLKDDWMVNGAFRFDYGKINVKQYTDWFPSQVEIDGQITEQYLDRAENFSRAFSSFNWSIGTNYNPGKLALKANVGTGFRMPIAKELASNGVNYHYYRYERGNPDLDPERSYQFDFGIEWKEQKWSVELTPFYNYFPNYIYLNPTAEHDVYYGAGNQVFKYEQSEVNRYGTELQLRYQFAHNLTAEVLAEYLYTVQISGAKEGYTLPFSPPASILTGITYNPEIKKLRDTYFTLDYRYTAEQNRIVPPEKMTPDSHVFNLAAGTKLKVGKQNINLSLQVQNLFNTRYLNHTSFYRLIELPEAGRNFIVSVKIPFLISKSN